MKGLKCTVENCELNNNCHCEAGIINISSNGTCKTKIRKHTTIDDEYKEMEASQEFEFDENDDVLVQCDCISCKYNNDHMCHADKVDIKNGMTAAKCATKCICK